MYNRFMKNVAIALVTAASTLGFASRAQASTLLTPAYEAQLSTWLGQGPLTFTNIYSAGSTDSTFNSYDWHSAVDGKGATFTLIEIQAGTYDTSPYGGYNLPVNIDRSVIGGYNPQSWSSGGFYNVTLDDAERTAFIYNLSTSILLRQILSTNDPNNAGAAQTFNYSSYGPTFGAGHDIYVNNSFTAYTQPYSYGTSYAPGLFGALNDGFYVGYLLNVPLARLETYTYSTRQSVPEPSTIALIGMALLSMFGLGLMRRRADA